MASMLPGFRFLFGAIIVSISILVFGLGAAALLRTAHEEFADAPVWRPTPEARFAQTTDATRPVIAMLRVDDASRDVTGDTIKDATASPPPADTVRTDAAAAQVALPPPQSDLNKTATPEPAGTPPSDAAKPRVEVVQDPVPVNPPQAEATAAPAVPDQPKAASAKHPSAEVPAASATQTKAEVATGPAPGGETATPPA
ncbi:MAG: hypothetical protein KGL62_10570, partial [Bradyrhizobium sp.]|nr:hypothetical protein [Bradyrhizobium sp.]